MAQESDDEVLSGISKRLDVLISLSIRGLTKDSDFSRISSRKTGVKDLTHYLAEFGLNAKEISQIIGSPISSVRTLLTPGRRK